MNIIKSVTIINYKIGGIFMLSNFSEKAQKVIAIAESIAFDFGHTCVGSEHLLLAFLKVKDTPIKNILEKQNITYEVIKSDLLNMFERKDSLPFYMEYSPAFKCIIEDSKKESKKINEDAVSVDVLASVLFHQNESVAYDLLKKYNCDFSSINNALNTSKIRVLDNIDELTNLNKKSKDNPVIIYERDNELEIVINTLLRKQKSNVMLVGEPGVGKSALVEYLAYKISIGDICDELKNKVVYELDIPSLVAGTKYRGEFEEKIKKILKKIIDDKDAIIFIDEVHNIIGAGGAEGAIDASNILKPYLARGNLKCIGATTYDEYAKIVEKEKAVDRRFQLIKLSEPDIQKSKKILKQIKNEYEVFHGIKISDKTCDKIVELANKHIHDRHFPDKAIDVLDCACVLSRKNEKNELDELSIILTIENLYNLKINESKDFDEMKKKMNKKIIGQSEAIDIVLQRLSYVEQGLVDDNKPLGVFMFAGPSGVGKTELTKLISKYYFGDENAFIKLDMSEYKEAGSISKLICASPGYVGYENQTLLIDKVRKNPHCLIVLDEIEKAHKDVLNIFLNVFDEGYFYDAKKRKIDFKNCIIIMTTNVINSIESNSVGFVNVTKNKEDLLKEISKFFSLELLNRIDEIVYFNSLSKDDAELIGKMILAEYKNKVKFEINESLIDGCNFDEDEVNKFGARYIKREIKKKILKELENRVEVR